jgi:hypothetical protein
MPNQKDSDTGDKTRKPTKRNADVFLDRFKKNTEEFAEMLIYWDSSDGMWCATDTNWIIFFRDDDYDTVLKAQKKYLDKKADVDNRTPCPVPRRTA